MQLKKLPSGRKVKRRVFRLPVQVVGKSAEAFGEGKEVIVIAITIRQEKRYTTKKALSRDELEDEAAKAPDVKTFFDGSGKD